MRRASWHFGRGFRVSIGNGRALAGHEDAAHNRHHRSRDQGLIVVSGIGQAISNGKRYPVRAGSLILLEPGERHEIGSTGRADLKTVNICLPPAYGQKRPRFARARPRKAPTITATEIDQVATRLQEPR